MDAKARILRDAARYLGIRGAPAGRALAVLEEAYPMAREAARPRSLIRRAPMRAREGVLIIGDALTIPSRDLCRLFAGAREGLALAITLGAPLDTLVRRLMLTDSALGAAVGACASALVDEVIDGLLREQAVALMREGLNLSPRIWGRPDAFWLRMGICSSRMPSGCFRTALPLPSKRGRICF